MTIPSSNEATKQKQATKQAMLLLLLWSVFGVLLLSCSLSASVPLPASKTVNFDALHHRETARGLEAGSFPPPFSRELKEGDTGRDVGIFQFLVYRAMNLSHPVDNDFGKDSAAATRMLQKQAGLKITGTMTLATAEYTMKHLTRDHYVDDGKPASARGYKYKVLIHVHANRSVESTGHLFAGNGTLLFSFPARLHGWDTCDCEKPWPDFNNTNVGLTSFASDGNTPTGLTEFDLNSPEGVPKLYGPYPVNRAVQGLEGNSKFLIPNIRDGILMHTGLLCVCVCVRVCVCVCVCVCACVCACVCVHVTGNMAVNNPYVATSFTTSVAVAGPAGEWPNWNPPQPMPNSSGCIHTWPQNCKHIADTLVELGVEIRPNTGGKLPYPYK